MRFDTIVDPSKNSSGNQSTARGGNAGDVIVLELHGRFYEQNYQGNLFSVGITATSIAAATFTTANGLSATLATAATSTPILGIWNPLSSTVNLVILQAILSGFISASTVTGTGGLIWAVYTGNTTISVANQQTPLNNKTLAASGSQAKGLNTIALTSLTNVGTYLEASSLIAGPATGYSQVGTAVGFPSEGAGPSVENIDGSIIVPPGGILALYGTVTPVAISVCGGLVWEEVSL